MADHPNYRFLVAESGGIVVGFAVGIWLPGTDAALLEYMAVRKSHRRSGVGRLLFKEALLLLAGDGRVLLIEVEPEIIDTVHSEARAKRKQFYRSLGCREIGGLVYIMPPVSGVMPPPLILMVGGVSHRSSLAKSELRSWLREIYSEVYGQSQEDKRVMEMLDPLPSSIRIV